MKPTVRKFAPIILIIGVFVFWEVFCLLAGISELVLPRPTRILAAFFEYAPAIMPHALADPLHHACGLLVRSDDRAFPRRILIGSSKLAYDTAYPLLVGISSIPKVAVVPILVLWFGAGTVPAILTAMIICIFPIVVNVSTGIATVEPELEDVMRSLKAKRWEMLWNVGLPRSMPYFFASLKVAITLSFVGSVIAETVASNKGVGNMMLIASSSFNVPLVFAGLMILAVMGITLYAIFSVVERRMVGWALRKQ